MKNNENPWAQMPNGTQKRISAETARNIFWITDKNGRYGFYIKTSNIFSGADSLPNLRGIKTLKRSTPDGEGELILLLNEADDWELFKILCDDLYANAAFCGADEEMMDAVEIRLRRWHLLLKRENYRPLTAEYQMGLFAELLCLKNLIAPKAGMKEAASAWVGPDYDKQDFLLANSAAEVKSYRTSKGRAVEISSLLQLETEKEKLYLIACGLTQTDSGQSIEDISSLIKTMLSAESAEILDSFENKLLSSGYAPEFVKEPLLKFKADSIKVYEVNSRFPKINPQTVPSEITAVNYTIDLGACGEFEVDFDNVIV